MKNLLMLAPVLFSLVCPSVRAESPLGFSPLEQALLRGTPEQLANLLGQTNLGLAVDQGLTPLQLACLSNTAEVVQMLLTASASFTQTTERGKTALHLAAEFNPRPEVVTVLLRAGADPEARDHRGRTPLMAAALHNTAPVVEALLAAGASPSGRDLEGRTAYLYATGELGQANRRLVGSPVVSALYRKRNGQVEP